MSSIEKCLFREDFSFLCPYPPFPTPLPLPSPLDLTTSTSSSSFWARVSLCSPGCPELTVYPMLALTSQQSFCLNVPDAEVVGVSHQTCLISTMTVWMRVCACARVCDVYVCSMCGVCVYVSRCIAHTYMHVHAFSGQRRVGYWCLSPHWLEVGCQGARHFTF